MTKKSIRNVSSLWAQWLISRIQNTYIDVVWPIQHQLNRRNRLKGTARLLQLPEENNGVQHHVVLTAELGKVRLQCIHFNYITMTTNKVKWLFINLRNCSSKEKRCNIRLSKSAYFSCVVQMYFYGWPDHNS